MERRETIYYRTGEFITFGKTSEYESREDILERIKEREFTLATKKEYDEQMYRICAERLKKSFDAEDIDRIVGVLSNNDNKYSIRAFSDMSGVKLSQTMKVRMLQLREYYGEKYAAWEKEEQEKKEEQEWKEAEERAELKKAALEKIETKYSSGDRIGGTDFLKLCDKYGVETHIRTRGFIKKSVLDVKNDGTHWLTKGKKTTGGFADAWRGLNRAMGIKKGE